MFRRIVYCGLVIFVMAASVTASDESSAAANEDTSAEFIGPDRIPRFQFVEPVEEISERQLVKMFPTFVDGGPWIKTGSGRWYFDNGIFDEHYLPPAETVVELDSSIGLQTLLLRSEEEVNLWSLAVYHWPEIFGTVVCLLALLFIRRMLKVVRNRQSVGENYCRKCNYQLTGVTGKHCPECGLELTERNRRSGRTAFRRLRIAFAITALSLSGYLISLAFEMPREGTLTDAFHIGSRPLDNWSYRTGKTQIARHRVEVDCVRVFRHSLDRDGRIIFKSRWGYASYVVLPKSGHVFVSDGRSAIVWNPRTDEIVQRLAAPSDVYDDRESGGLVRARASADGRSVVTALGGKLLRWRLDSNRVTIEKDDSYIEFMKDFQETAPGSGLFMTDRPEHLGYPVTGIDSIGTCIVKDGDNRIVSKFDTPRLEAPINNDRDYSHTFYADYGLHGTRALVGYGPEIGPAHIEIWDLPTGKLVGTIKPSLSDRSLYGWGDVGVTNLAAVCETWEVPITNPDYEGYASDQTEYMIWDLALCKQAYQIRPTSKKRSTTGISTFAGDWLFSSFIAFDDFDDEDYEYDDCFLVFNGNHEPRIATIDLPENLRGASTLLVRVVGNQLTIAMIREPKAGPTFHLLRFDLSKIQPLKEPTNPASN